MQLWVEGGRNPIGSTRDASKGVNLVSALAAELGKSQFKRSVQLFVSATLQFQPLFVPESGDEAREQLAVRQFSPAARLAQLKEMASAEQQRNVAYPFESEGSVRDGHSDRLLQKSPGVTRIDKPHRHPSSNHSVSVSRQVKGIPLRIRLEVAKHVPNLFGRIGQKGMRGDVSLGHADTVAAGSVVRDGSKIHIKVKGP